MTSSSSGSLPQKAFSGKPDSGENIDIIDVFAFLWRSRVWVSVSVAVSLAVAALFLVFVRPPVYVTSVPVTFFEVSASDSLSAAAAKFNAFAESTKFVSDVSSKGRFISGALKLASIEGLPVIEIRSDTRDSSGERARELMALITSQTKEYNRELIGRSASSAEVSGPAQAAGFGVEMGFAALVSRQTLEEAPIKLQIFSLESKLAKSLDSRSVDPAGLDDRVLRLLASAGSKIAEAERIRVVHEYAQLIGRLESIKVKYEKSLKVKADGLQSVSHSLVTGFDDSSGKIPVFAINEGIFRSNVLLGTHERYESKRLVTLSAGLVFGGLVGLVLYGVKLFLLENMERLKFLFKKNKNSVTPISQ